MTAHDRRQSKRYYEREVTLRWLKAVCRGYEDNCNTACDETSRQNHANSWPYWHESQWQLWGGSSYKDD